MNKPYSRNVAQYFDDFAQDYDHISTNELSYKAPQVVFGVLSDYFKENMRVLDVGIGTGQLSALFKKQSGAYVVGVDYSENMLEICKRKKRADETHQVDLTREALPFKARKFDIVAACGISEFINPLGKLLKDMARVAKVGGVVAITYEIARDNKNISSENRDGMEMYAYSPAHVKRLLRAAGMEVLAETPIQSYKRGRSFVPYALTVGKVAALTK